MTDLRLLSRICVQARLRRAGNVIAWSALSCLTGVVGSYHPPTAAQPADAEPLAVVQTLYAAFGENDMAGILTLVDPGVVWIFHGPENVIPYAGTHKGRAGVEQFFTVIAETIDVKAIGRRHVSAEGNVVSVVGWERAIHRETGGEYVANWVHVFTVQNGLITRFEEIADSGALIEAFTPADVERGRAYYTTCAACHGLYGEGNAGMHAPSLTAQGAEYLVRQVRNFRRQIRGGVADFYGWQMNGRAKALSGDRAVRDVVAYIENLPNSMASPTIQGDTVRGQVIYAGQCASCHGSVGEGVPALDSPPLAGLQDWYQLAQLANYRSGTRGTDERNHLGTQMRPYAVALNSEDAMKDVVAYIATLKGI